MIERRMTSTVLSNPSQLVLRNADLLSGRRLLIVGMPDDGLVPALWAESGTSQLQGLTRDFSVFGSLAPAWPSEHLHFGSVLADSQHQPYDGVLIFLQKSRPLMEFWLDMVLSVLAPQGRVWLVGENAGGIKSWRKRLKHYFSEVQSLDSARHCGLLEGCAAFATGHAFNPGKYFTSYSVSLNGQDRRVFSLPGVFSHGRLDRGSALLVETFKGIQAKKTVLDFGCGAGVLAAALAAELPEAALTLVDSDALALESSHKTLEDNQVASFRVLASDGLAEVKGVFELIVSNPPFHQGIHTEYAVSERFLVDSYRHLTVGGELRIVANSFLQYPPIIKRIFGQCETLASRDGFSVYGAIRRG